MKIKVSNTTKIQLDWLVVKIEGRECYVETGPKSGKKYLMAFTHCCLTGEKEHSEVFNPSENWSQGGPIIDREKIGVDYYNTGKPLWIAGIAGTFQQATGPTPLTAAMRCFVASRLGNEVEVPDELQ